VHCVTEGCRGYVSLLGVFEGGQPGQELSKNYLFNPTAVSVGWVKRGGGLAGRGAGRRGGGGGQGASSVWGEAAEPQQEPMA
jgi:hypothetical protein